MTYNNFKKHVVEEESWATSKEVVRYTINVGLTTFIIASICGLLVITTFARLSGLVVTLISCMLLFMTLFDYASISRETFDKAMKFTKFWWLFLVILIGLVFVLHYFRFI